MKSKFGTKVAVYWRDIKVYYDGGLHGPTTILTEGVLVRNRKNYLLLKNPETLLLDSIRNHPKKKPRFYWIPKSMITEVVEVNEQNNQ